MPFMCQAIFWVWFPWWLSSILLPMQETQEMWLRSLGQEVPLEKEMATHSGILAWRIPWTEEPRGLQCMGFQRVRHDWACMKSHSLLAVSLQCNGKVHYTDIYKTYTHKTLVKNSPSCITTRHLDQATSWCKVMGGAGDGHLILQVLAFGVIHQPPPPPPPDICTTCWKGSRLEVRRTGLQSKHCAWSWNVDLFMEHGFEVTTLASREAP